MYNDSDEVLQPFLYFKKKTINSIFQLNYHSNRKVVQLN